MTLRGDVNESREGFRAVRAPPPAAKPTPATPVYGGTERSYGNNKFVKERIVPSNTPSRRGSRRLGGTGSLQRLFCIFLVQHSSLAVQQSVAAQQYSQRKLGSTAQQHLQHSSRASRSFSCCSASSTVLGAAVDHCRSSLEAS